MPKSSRASFVDTLRGVAERHGLEFRALSKDWIIQIADPASGRQCSVFGYTFDINPAAAVEVCREKSATSLVLDAHGVPNINHAVFLSPAHVMTADYVPKSGVWTGIQKSVAELGFPVVLKPLKGTGGMGVTKCACPREVEAAVQHLFEAEYGLAVSPYKAIVDEYRCFYLDGKVEFIYRKIRSHLSGDGVRSLSALVAEKMAAAAPAEAVALCAAVGAEFKPEELGRVPAAGEVVPLQWKHNLGQGASVDVQLAPGQRERLEAIAAQAASAIGIRFCSVDVVDVEVEGLLVMEVNGGVMMDSLMGQLGDDGKALAARLYETAVLRALGREGA